MALGVDSASNRNEYQEHFPGGKGGRCVRLILPSSCAVVMQSGNINFLGPSGPLQACNGTVLMYLCIPYYTHDFSNGSTVFSVRYELYLHICAE